MNIKYKDKDMVLKIKITHKDLQQFVDMISAATEIMLPLNEWIDKIKN
jgi:hypothetical protein